MNNQNKLLLAASAVTILNFNSCSKYEEGPAFSLIPKNNRLVGEWELVKMDGEDIEDYFNNLYVVVIMGLVDNLMKLSGFGILKKTKT